MADAHKADEHLCGTRLYARRTLQAVVRQVLCAYEPLRHSV
jgi:hypothetical protein